MVAAVVAAVAAKRRKARFRSASARCCWPPGTCSATEKAGEREVERDADNARMLAEVQKTLAEQATTLVERAKARLLTGADENVASFVEEPGGSGQGDAAGG